MVIVNTFSFKDHHLNYTPETSPRLGTVHEKKNLHPLYTYFFLKELLFFGQALMFLFFSRLKPKNILRGYIFISIYIYDIYDKNIEIQGVPSQLLFKEWIYLSFCAKYFYSENYFE